MTKSNEISQANPDHASRRGSWVLWASILSGVAAIAIMVVVLLTVYNTEKKYTVGVQTIAGLDAEITRLGERREALLGLVETSNDE